MYGVPQAGLTVPAVAGRLERGVRPHRRTRPRNVAKEHTQLTDLGLAETLLAQARHSHQVGLDGIGTESKD